MSLNIIVRVQTRAIKKKSTGILALPTDPNRGGITLMPSRLFSVTTNIYVCLARPALGMPWLKNIAETDVQILDFFQTLGRVWVLLASGREGCQLGVSSLILAVHPPHEHYAADDTDGQQA